MNGPNGLEEEVGEGKETEAVGKRNEAALLTKAKEAAV
jgi:hypothetical protein